MAKFLLYILIPLGLCGTVISCSRPNDGPQVTKEYRVLLPWGENGRYDFQVVTLRTLQNLRALEGSTASFSMGFQGPPPRLQMSERRDGVLFPTEPMSQQLLTLYAHLEKLRDLDSNLGIGEVIPRPFPVAVRAKLINPGNQKIIRNNAQYSSKNRGLFFAPFESSDELTFLVNAGVIAHEYFHALFDQLLLRPIQVTMPTELFEEEWLPHSPRFENEKASECPRIPEMEKLTDKAQLKKLQREIYHIRLLRAMNEGLADLWGWIYSGDTDFVGRSINKMRGARDLDAPKIPVASAREFARDSRAFGVCGRLSGQAFVYDLASRYAFWIKNEFNSVPKMELARVTLQVIERLRVQILSMTEEEFLKPAHLIEHYARVINEARPDICGKLLGWVDQEDLLEPGFQCSKPAEETL